ncbi:MAG: hypothetical protein M3Y28_10345 [Armatimonadota bacterium]|nr:hypothetical protein [Armatimonadota bacterium]
MPLAFVDRPPSAAEVEKLRLLLSAYQDGTGMLTVKGGQTLPGWRDFERAVALAFGGAASESKDIFDVVLSRPDEPPSSLYGVSCKMRSELNRIDRDGRVTIEVSNSAGKFWDHLATKALNQTNYKDSASEVGEAVIVLVNGWHQAQSSLAGGRIVLDKSFYLVLSWSRQGWYQMHQFPLNLIDLSALRWSFPVKAGATARRLVGEDATGTLVEWYGESGGQLKFYPLAQDALWHSERFQLEPLPETTQGILGRVAAYYPEKWAAANKDAPE